MLVTRVFHLMMSSDTWLEVTAEDVMTAIEAGRGALPHLRSTEEERADALLVASDVRYTLTCLLCGAVNPTRQEANPLVVMQEHLMEQHHVTPEQLRAATRVFTGTDWAGQYVWSFLPRVPQNTGLPYLRASRYTTAARAYPLSRGNEEQVLFFAQGDIPAEARAQGDVWLQSISLPSNSQASSQVALAGEDALAWYGYPYEGEFSWALMVWPKQEWQVIPRCVL